MGSAGMGAGGVGGADLLTRAFNEAVRPYTEKIDMLEQQLADMQDWVQGQEQQRMEIFAWIDKRGLRPGMFLHYCCTCGRCLDKSGRNYFMLCWVTYAHKRQAG